MNVLSIVSALLSLASYIAEYARDRQLIGAGEARQLSRTLGESLATIERAQAARRAVKHDVDSIMRDKQNRDGQ